VIEEIKGNGEEVAEGAEEIREDEQQGE